MKKRVLVGMSGGVDSSVCAALLKKRGYDVIGITMQLLPKETEHDSACCNLNAINDAKRVASILKIPHYTINIRDNFKHHVIDDFVSSYLSGLTPNPCVECNRHIKFDELRKKAKELGAQYIATGHYCKKTYSRKNGYFLKKAADANKDQSYFLHMLTSEQLQYTLFPLAPFTKPEIRKMAEDFGLINAKKPDSQEICFVTQGKYQEFIEEQIDNTSIKPGLFIDTKGIVVGKHQGLHRYTIGQRKGLGINSQTPLYVLKIDAANNTITVGEKEDLQVQRFTLSPFTKVNSQETIRHKKFHIKTRYQMTPFIGTVISDDKGKIQIEALTPQSQITPGQSGVLYDKDRIVGGGKIVISPAFGTAPQDKI